MKTVLILKCRRGPQVGELIPGEERVFSDELADSLINQKVATEIVPEKRIRRTLKEEAPIIKLESEETDSDIIEDKESV